MTEDFEVGSPRPLKADVGLLRVTIAFDHLDRSTRELWGTRGESEYDSIVTSLFGRAERDDAANLRGAAIETIRALGPLTKTNMAEALRVAREARSLAMCTVPVVDKRKDPHQAAEEAAQREAAHKAARLADDANSERTRTLARRAPASAGAWIVAELDENRSDAMTDYFAHTATRRVVLGFRTGSREDFRQLRTMAGSFPETAHLEGGDESVEHRETYSMGSGNYLKAGSNDSSGWRVRSRMLRTRDGEIVPPFGAGETWETGPWFDSTKGLEGQTETATPAGHGTATVAEHWHDKKGVAYWLVINPVQTSKDVWGEQLQRAKASGGWYSRAWAGRPGGFAFLTESAAQDFAATL